MRLKLNALGIPPPEMCLSFPTPLLAPTRRSSTLLIIVVFFCYLSVLGALSSPSFFPDLQRLPSGPAPSVDLHLLMSEQWLLLKTGSSISFKQFLLSILQDFLRHEGNKKPDQQCLLGKRSQWKNTANKLITQLSCHRCLRGRWESSAQI